MFLASKNFIESLKKTLAAKGTCVVPEANSFLAVDQWKSLNHEARKLKYEEVSKVDGDENFSCKIARIKRLKTNDINNKVIFNVVNSVQSKRLISLITEMNHFIIDKCQSHFYEEGDFASPHCTKGNGTDYKYVVSFFLENPYHGGDLVIHRSGKKKFAYTPRSGETVISSCDFHHEVRPVLSGHRNVVLAFIRPHQSGF